MSPPTLGVTPTTSRNIAVIGAGAAGLVAARELRREGHQVVVFERNNKIGGTWVYDPNVESDPMSLLPSRTIVHSSLYSSLRTNLPREAMGFRDYPFVAAKEDGKRDSRRYPGHEEVLQYLINFACEFLLNELIWFETEVVRVWLVEEGKWGVRYRKGSDGSFADEVFDGVVVCSGHHTEPNVAVIPGLDVWPGKQIHSHNYRVPEPFCDQVVIVIGSSYSGFDISRDIAKVAKEVHVASRSFINGSPVKVLGHDNIWLHSMVELAHDDGTVVLQDGRSVVADVILHCTGYRYHFPFLEMADTVTVDDNRVGPLYKHIFPPHLAPGLSFVGIPWMLLPFTVWELQSKWVASILSGRVSLPSQEVMMSDVEAFYSQLESTVVPKRYTHKLVNHQVIQFDYYDWLSTECGIPPLEEWRKQMYAAHVQNAVARYETFRDEWDDQNLVLEAEEDFLTYTHSSSDSPITR